MISSEGALEELLRESEEVAHTEENVVFNIPRILRDAEKKQTA